MMMRAALIAGALACAIAKENATKQCEPFRIVSDHNGFGNAIFALSAAILRSEANAITAPAPAAVPLMAAMMGFLSRRMFRMTSPVIRAKAVISVGVQRINRPMMS